MKEEKDHTILSIVFVIILCFLIALITVGYSNVKLQDYSAVTEKSELSVICSQQESSYLLDLRDDSDYQSSHLIGSVGITYEEENEAWFLQKVGENCNKNQDIYLLCYSGKRSAKAFNLLVKAGYRRVHIVIFGYADYINDAGEINSEGADVCDCVREK